ncbi:uncharacterized protein LOC127777042 [Oryza glaberrima]|uniref:uncharacterized protein LOC127777042 n=1 Tax=Oryza glaberrima TaxID=4538 RepID=UPI00224BFF75|nr:uncharacterized protein LOC127777042 [Oryza glaberrima]
MREATWFQFVDSCDTWWLLLHFSSNSESINKFSETPPAVQPVEIDAQLSSFTVDVLSDLNAFHRSTVHSLQGDSSRYLQFYTILNPGGFPRDKI